MTEKYKQKENGSLIFPPPTVSKHKILLKSYINFKFALNVFPKIPHHQAQQSQVCLAACSNLSFDKMKMNSAGAF